MVPSIGYGEGGSVVLLQGTPAPYDGLLLTNDKANETRLKLLENDSLQRSVELYKKNEVLYDQKINILLEQNKAIVESNSPLTNFEKIGLVVLGIALGIGAVHVGKTL